MDSFVLLMRVVVVEKGEEGVERVGEWRVVYQGSRSETSLPIPKSFLLSLYSATLISITHL